MGTLLIVDDEKNVISSFKKILSQDGYRVLSANNAEDGLALAKENAPDLLIMDIRMPGMSGLEAVSEFKKINARLPIIIMTAFGTTDTAIEAMRLGAYDYVIKPFDIPKMKEIVRGALNAATLMKTEVTYEIKKEFRGDRIVGVSGKMQEIYKTIGQAAPCDTTVLLRGERGTGKELIARAIYHHSKRKTEPFWVVNCADVPEMMLERELFGYEKGAFFDARSRRIGKLEQCDGGTLFLDEIGEMPLAIQAKVLRVIESKTFERLGSNQVIEVDVRLIASTNRDLQSLIKQGKFREDLYYRLAVVNIEIPPLRERKEDIAGLTDYFLAKYKEEAGKDVQGISSAAMKGLLNYAWPGNVQELENMIKKAVIFSRSNFILPEDCLVSSSMGVSNDEDRLKDIMMELAKAAAQKKEGAVYREIMDDVEQSLIIEMLKQYQGNQSRVAKVLGISRPTLKEKMDKYGLKIATHLEDSVD
jgi:DNA-binding NtrC family response regulator